MLLFPAVVLPMKDNQEEEYRLMFISSGMLSTAELSILEAKKEINSFAERCHRMFGIVVDLLHIEKDEEFNKQFSRVEKYENITDSMEVEIANYLHKVSEGRLSDDSKGRIQRMMRQIDELESIGDSCYHLGRTINRQRKHSKEGFTQEQMERMHTMMVLVNSALEEMVKMVAHPEFADVNYIKSRNIETEINNYRSHLKSLNIQDINEGKYSYQLGVYYTDFISECEKLGDYVINVVQAAAECASHK